MTWHQHVVALWDGADYLALFFDAQARPGGELYVYTSADAAGERHLAAVLPDHAKGQLVYLVSLPEGHRFVTVELASANDSSLSVTLDEGLTPTGDTERRLVLLHVSSDGEPGLDSLSSASVLRSVASALVADGLKIVRNRVDGANRTAIWGVCCTERRLLPKGANSGIVHLALSPCQIAYPEARRAAPIELEPVTLSADAVPQDKSIASRDPSWPLIVQTILAELDRRPQHGIRVSASRGNPFVQWILRRSAALHVRRQIHATEFNRQALADQPFGDEELIAIGETPANSDEHETIELTVPAQAPAILASSLWRLLRNQSQAMAGVRTEQRSVSAKGDASVDQVTLWFDGATLGDDIGIVSTQPSVLNIFPGVDADAEPRNVVMFRVTSSGLEPLSVPADEMDSLITEAAKVQERDLGTDTHSDQLSRSLDAARRNLERWSAQQFGGTPQISFSGLEPLVVMGLASVGATERSKYLLDLYRRDPALCTLLVANGADAARLERVALQRSPPGAHLLRRFADSYDAGNMIAADGVKAAVEIDALKMLSDPASRSRLRAARIALDSSTDNLREIADAALAILADRSSLVPLAQSLQDRGRSTEAQRISKHVDEFKAGVWIPLAQASQLAIEVHAWQAEHAAIENRIEGISIEVGTTSPEGSRSADDIRKSIDGILETIESRPDLEASINAVKQTFDLASLDRRQLVRLENRVLTLVYGPARERLVNAVLSDLEEWAGLRELLNRLCDSGGHSDSLRKRGRREGAVLFINRVETMQAWRVPISAPAQDAFTQSRIDLREWIVARKRTDTGSGEPLEQDFQTIVIPVGDIFLHHKAFLALRGLTNTLKARLAGDAATRTLDRQLTRGLVKWPDGAAETWSAATDLAARIGRNERDHLGAALAIPGLSPP
jgi:hypothetical protein